MNFDELIKALADCEGSVATLRILEIYYPMMIKFGEGTTISKSCSIDYLLEHMAEYK